MVEISREPKSDCAIAGRVQFIRKLLGYNRENFARAVRISTDQLYNYENMRTAIPCGVILRICRTFFIDEKWMALCEGLQRPGVDLMGHPAYLGVDPSAPFSQEFPSLEPAYDKLSALPFFELVDRHLLSCGSDRFRLKLFNDFMFSFYSEGINAAFYAELVGCALGSVRKYLEHNGVEYAFGKGIVSGGSYKGLPE